MKKVLSVIIIMAMVCTTFLSSAFAVVDYEPCGVNDHEWLLINENDYGGTVHYFAVNSCHYSNTRHNHITMQYATDYTYVCSACGKTKTVRKVVYGYDEMNICCLHDNG